MAEDDLHHSEVVEDGDDGAEEDDDRHHLQHDDGGYDERHHLQHDDGGYDGRRRIRLHRRRMVSIHTCACRQSDVMARLTLKANRWSVKVGPKTNVAPASA